MSNLVLPHSLKMKNHSLFFLIFIALTIASCKNHSVQIIHTASAEITERDSVHIIKGVFDIPELKINPSPDAVCEYIFPSGHEIIDYEVSPAGQDVAVIVKEESDCQLLIWKLGAKDAFEIYKFQNGFIGKCITWHPMAHAIFVIESSGKEYQIIRLERIENTWTEKIIFSTPEQLRNLIACPRPFITDYDERLKGSRYEYRLFFGMDNGNGTFRTVSITELGHRFYQVIGPENTMTKAESLDAYVDPSKMTAGWALPSAFHPAGNELVWLDKSNNVFVAKYNRDGWEGFFPLKLELPHQGTIVPTSNGLGFLQWQKGIPGIGIFLISTGKMESQLTACNFSLPPSQVPDGKGIVGLTVENGKWNLKYLPISLPLPDVSNAWMFIQSQNELELFKDHYGVFRPNHSDQIYKLYETENYYCDHYDRNSPTRPYLVTTDIFWELFGSAYQGLFIVRENHLAIPNFWNFVFEANTYFTDHESKWGLVFKVLTKYYENDSLYNSEVQHIREAKNYVSLVTGKEFAFSDLKPRGHYTSSTEMEKYFKAFKYLTTILKDDTTALVELNGLPAGITSHAEAWISAYYGFIAPSRSKLVWNCMEKSLPDYCMHPAKSPAIFPLSWGFDNEVLYSTIYHRDLPEEFQVKGPEGFRLLPSGLDLAAVLGNGFADRLLEQDYEKYPPLRKVIGNLRENYRDHSKGPDFKDNIYNQWLNAIALQWTDSLNSTNGLKDLELWKSKRLQSGLATWATLRHATVLVNEQVGAECGEGGFEEILMRAPRGYVEPDPFTFNAIADLFEAVKKLVPPSIADHEDINETYSQSSRSLFDGIIARLDEAAKESRNFSSMAEKERKGMELSNAENEKILFVAGIAEHLFLIFNSLANKDYALSLPDPMPKITDVSGNGLVSPYLMVAVGNTMEWDYIVPFYGRQQIVKGSVYSYYEFESGKLINDLEWREKVNGQEFLPWIKPYISERLANDMASSGYGSY